MSDRTILYISPQIPYPLDVGIRIRIFNLLSAYARLGKVRLVFFYQREEELAGMDALKPYCDSFHPVSSRTRYEERFFMHPPWRRRLEQALTRMPLNLRLLFSTEMQRIVEDLAPASDIVHVSRLQLAPYIESLFRKRPDGQRFVLDLDDLETVIKRREFKLHPSAGWKRNAWDYLNLLRLWFYQRKALRLFDRVFVCSEKDRVCLGQGRNVVVVPNGANVPEAIFPDESDGRTLLYLGTLSYPPNRDGLFFFLNEIFPRIRKEVAGARLFIVGKNPPAEITELHDGKTIWVEGNVPSVEKYYRQSTVSIVPLRMGSGTRLKILEAFAMGRPVVSTSVGCEGLRVANGEHLLISDDPIAFATSCVDLLKNPLLREGLVLRARKLVEGDYTWEAVQALVENRSRELLEKGP